MPLDFTSAVCERGKAKCVRRDKKDKRLGRVAETFKQQKRSNRKEVITRKSKRKGGRKKREVLEEQVCKWIRRKEERWERMKKQ